MSTNRSIHMLEQDAESNSSYKGDLCRAMSMLAEDERVVNLSLTDLGNDLIFEVEDSGTGISEEVAGHIFEKGVSTSDHKGKGIGLYLVKDLLATIQGHITIDKSSLGGVLFTVYISKRQQSYG